MKVIEFKHWQSPDDCARDMWAHRRWEGGAGAAWQGGITSDEARRRARFGEQSLAANSDALVDRFLHNLPETQRRRWSLDVAGAFPDVPRHLAGHDPRTMRRRTLAADDTAPVRIFSEMGASSNISAEQYAKRGAAVLAFARAISMQRPVELLACHVCKDSSGPIDYVSRVLIWSCRLSVAPLNLSLAAAWLCHVGVYRGALVSLPEREHGFDNAGYTAKAAEMPTVRTILNLSPDDVYIPGCFDGDPIIDDPENWLTQALTEARLMGQ